MKIKFVTIPTFLLVFGFVLLSLVFSSCKNDDEFNLEHIPGEYTGSLTYWHSLEGDGVSLSSSDPTKGDEFITTIKRAGSNYVLSFDKSFIIKIPDITFEITPIKDSDSFTIITLPGQAYNSVITQKTYWGETSNYIWISKYPQVVNCNLSLRSNNPDSINFIEIRVLRIY